MLAVAVLVLVIATLLLSGFAFNCRADGQVSLAPLWIAAAVSVALTAAAITLIPSWEAQMQHVNFAAMNRARVGTGKFPELGMLTFYLFPYEAALFGAIAMGGLGLRLYRRIRYGY